jgi:hypothetical protein
VLVERAGRVVGGRDLVVMLVEPGDQLAAEVDDVHSWVALLGPRMLLRIAGNSVLVLQ